MRIVGIVQARMGSDRLPGKVLLPINGKPMIVQLVDRLENCSNVDEWIVTIPNTKENFHLKDVLVANSIKFHTGPEEDVLSRYAQAAKVYGADTIVRITGDCPLHDPSLVDEMIQEYLEGDYDLVTNTRKRTYPDGFDCEIFTKELLEQTNYEAKRDFCREHVTVCMEPINPFHVRYYLGSFSHLRATVDTIEDYHTCKRIFEKLYYLNPLFDWWDVVCALKNL